MRKKKNHASNKLNFTEALLHEVMASLFYREGRG